MKTILTAIALTIALPVMAHAQTNSTPAPMATDHENVMGCKGMPGHKNASGHDMAAMKNHMASMKGPEMAGMKGHDMAGLSKQDHEKMMLACGKRPAQVGTMPSTVQPTHKM